MSNKPWFKYPIDVSDWDSAVPPETLNLVNNKGQKLFKEPSTRIEIQGLKQLMESRNPGKLYAVVSF